MPSKNSPNFDTPARHNKSIHTCAEHLQSHLLYMNYSLIFRAPEPNRETRGPFSGTFYNNDNPDQKTTPNRGNKKCSYCTPFAMALVYK
jgi:hypothetical protein